MLTPEVLEPCTFRLSAMKKAALSLVPEGNVDFRRLREFHAGEDSQGSIL